MICICHSARWGDCHPTVALTAGFGNRALLVLVFLNFLPYSKHLHLVSSLINIFFSKEMGRVSKSLAASGPDTA